MLSSALILFGLLLLSAGTLCGQSGPQNPLDDGHGQRRQIFIGPSLTLMLNRHERPRRLPAATCPDEVEATTVGYGIGLGLELLPTVKGRWRIVTRLMLQGRPSRSSITIDGAVARASQEIDMITFDLHSYHEVMSNSYARFGFFTGPSISYREAGEESISENARDVTFCFDVARVEADPFRLSLQAGLFAELGLFNDVWIMTPSLGVDLDGASIYGDEEAWIVHSLMMTVDFRTAF